MSWDSQSVNQYDLFEMMALEQNKWKCFDII